MAYGDLDEPGRRKNKPNQSQFYVPALTKEQEKEKNRSEHLLINRMRLIMTIKCLTFGSWSGKIVVIGKVGCII